MSFDNDNFDKCRRDKSIYSITGLFVGLVCILCGFYLVYFNINGTIEWSAKIFESSSTIKNASPGVILMIVGLLIIRITRTHGTSIQRKIDINGNKIDKIMFSLNKHD
jgi:hypothetical protein